MVSYSHENMCRIGVSWLKQLLWVTPLLEEGVCASLGRRSVCREAHSPLHKWEILETPMTTCCSRIERHESPAAFQAVRSLTRVLYFLTHKTSRSRCDHDRARKTSFERRRRVTRQLQRQKNNRTNRSHSAASCAPSLAFITGPVRMLRILRRTCSSSLANTDVTFNVPLYVFALLHLYQILDVHNKPDRPLQNCTQARGILAVIFSFQLFVFSKSSLSGI